MNHFVIQKGIDRQVVFYWYQGRGRVIANDTQQGAAHARCGAAASNERGTRAVDYPGCDDPRGGDPRAHRVCHACASVVGCTPAMKHMSRRFAAVALVTLVALAAPACSRDPQKQAEKYVASGDAYVARQQFNQAAMMTRTRSRRSRNGRTRITSSRRYMRPRRIPARPTRNTRERRISNRRISMPSCRPACSCFPQESSKRHERGRNSR